MSFNFQTHIHLILEQRFDFYTALIKLSIKNMRVVFFHFHQGSNSTTIPAIESHVSEATYSSGK